MKIRLFTVSPPEKDLPVQDSAPFAAQTAGGGAQEVVVFTAHQPVRVGHVWLAFNAALNGAATNNVTVTVNRYTSAGTLVGAVGAVTFASGTNAAKFGAVDLATLSGTGLTNNVLAKGDTLTLAQAQNGSGLACPAGKVEIDYGLGGTPRY